MSPGTRVHAMIFIPAHHPKMCCMDNVVVTEMVISTAWVTGAWWWELTTHVGNSAQQDSVVCVNGV